jgi:hypothetical protein
LLKKVKPANILGSNLSQIRGLSDPNADKLLFWDDSAGSFAHLSLGTNLSITGTTIDAAGGGGGSPGGSNTQVQYNNSSAFAGSANFTWTNASNQLLLKQGAGSDIPLKLMGEAATGFPQLLEFRNQVYGNSAYILWGSSILYFEAGDNSSGGVRFTNDGGSYQPVTIYTGAATNSGAGRVDVTTTNAASIGVAIHLAASQTANAWEIQPNGSSTPLAAFLAGGGLLMQERSDPAAPATNNGILYVRDNGSGKSQLVVRFPTGAVQVIATEP